MLFLLPKILLLYILFIGWFGVLGENVFIPLDHMDTRMQDYINDVHDISIDNYNFHTGCIKYWSDQSACAMCHQTQWPLLTRLRLLSLSSVQSPISEGLYQGFECKLILTK